MNKFFHVAAALIALAPLAPAHAMWVGGGGMEVKTDRFTGETSRAYKAERNECGLTKSIKPSSMAACTLFYSPGVNQLLLSTFNPRGWESLHFRAAVNAEGAPVIITHNDGRVERTRLTVALRTLTVRGSGVQEAFILNVPKTMAKIEVQYGSKEMWFTAPGSTASAPSVSPQVIPASTGALGIKVPAMRGPLVFPKL